MSSTKHKTLRTEHCSFFGHCTKSGRIVLKPIGRAVNSVKKPTLTGWRTLETDLVINRRLAKGLQGLERYSHVIVVYWMDQEKECHLRHHPQNRADVPFVGVFACRCPQRPNPIAISTVRLLGRRGNVVRVKGLDILNGTPILDLKPYTPQYDDVSRARVPVWVSRLRL